MSKFMIACPVYGRYNEASTGFFASKRIRCTCGNIINVKTDKMASCRCANCGNDVVYDQSKAKNAKCPVCGEKLLTDESINKRITFRCPTCACELSVQKGEETPYTCPICDTKIDVEKEARLAEQRDKGIPAVIQYEGGANTLVWKHPMTDFVMGSQLIVHETQEAIFLRNGEALDSLPAGQHDLETDVLPKMNSLFKLPAQGQPFHAEVYFVNLITLMNIKWGTSSKVGLFDPVSGLHVELGASGTFNLRVSDARRLLMRLVGTADALTQEQLFGGETGYFRTLIMNRVKSNLARIIKDNHINVLELDERLDSISAHLQTAINENLAEYGLTMPEFFISNIAMPDDENFNRLKQQHADLYLKTREEQIKKAEAEAAFERKVVQAQTEARVKVIGAQAEADAYRMQAEAEADAYRMQAEAEAQEMRMKGYTYQQETARQVGVTAMRNNSGAAGGIGGMAGDVMSVGVGLGAVGSVIGMAKDAITPIAGAVGEAMQPEEGWACVCGQKGNRGNFCMNCGAKKPEMPKPWDCACGSKGILGNFCPNCGAKQPEAPTTWDCTCGNKGIIGNFCTNCGKKRDE